MENGMCLKEEHSGSITRVSFLDYRRNHVVRYLIFHHTLSLPSQLNQAVRILYKLYVEKDIR
jgi:hypothetical protein